MEPSAIHLGADHGGYAMKERLAEMLRAEGYPVVDHGTDTFEAADYPRYAAAVGEAVTAQPGTFGILACRSGEGMAIAANKVRGVRAALVWRPDLAVETRRDNDANVLVLPGDFLTGAEAEAVTRAFLSAPFSAAERHVRRIAAITALEVAA